MLFMISTQKGNKNSQGQISLFYVGGIEIQKKSMGEIVCPFCHKMAAHTSEFQETKGSDCFVSLYLWRQ